MARLPATALQLDQDQRADLTAWARSRVLPQRQVLRARIVLLASEGVVSSEIAEELHCSEPTVRLWRRRFEAAGVAGLESDAPGRGRPRTHGDGVVGKVLSVTLGRPPTGETRWSSRAVAARVGVSPSTVQRVWRESELQPHRTRAFKPSTDPLLAEKVTDVVGLYLHPPEKAVVLCVDEKSQIQPIDRTPTLLPLRSGQPERRAHDYVRHGTATLFAALDVATGEVVGKTYARHRHQEFLRFLELVRQRYPRGDLRLVLDNYRTHKHPEVQTWLDRHRRFRLHCIPTGASWLNQVETWFSIIHRKAIRRGIFRSVAHLKDAIQRFLDAWSARTHPFTWVNTADDIVSRATPNAISEPGAARAGAGVVPLDGIAMSAVEAFNRRLLRARDTMDRAFAEPLDVAALARVASLSEAHFIRSFRATFGETPHRYLQRRRVERSMFRLRETDRSVTDICFSVGFTSVGTFSRTFREIVGETPSDYRVGHEPMLPPNCFQMAAMRPVVSATEAVRLSSSGEAAAAAAP